MRDPDSLDEPPPLRLVLDRPALRAVAVLAALALLAGAIFWMRAGGDQGAAALVPATPAAPTAALVPAGPSGVAGSASAQGYSPPAPATSASSAIVVDVVGPVRRPGIVTVPAGSRVADVIAAAGGLTKATPAAVNLARLVQDGEQVDVSGRSDSIAGAGPAAAAGGSAPGSGTGTPGGPVHLNTATPEQLDSLPRVGPVTAQHIIDFRTQHGGFRSVEQLLEVPGIGDATLAQLAPLVAL